METRTTEAVKHESRGEFRIFRRGRGGGGLTAMRVLMDP